MNNKISKDFVSINTKITSVIPNNNVIPSVFPLTGLIEVLVDPPIEPKSARTDYSLQY